MTAIPTAATLAEYVGTDATADAAFLSACLGEAGAIVARLAGAGTIEAVADAGAIPAEIVARAVLETAADQYSRRRARNGIVELGGDGVVGDVVRISRDPSAAARPVLAPWLGPALA